MVADEFSLNLALLRTAFDDQSYNGVGVSPHGEKESTLASVDRFLVSSVADVSEHLHLTPTLDNS